MYMDVSWNGTDPEDTSLCPYPVVFHCKPAPAESLNSLESGRLLLQVNLGRDVKSVAGRLVNNAKRGNLGRLFEKQEEDEKSAHNVKTQTLLSTVFVQDAEQPTRWMGELSIPASWVEGRTRTHERTGASSPKSSLTNLYTLEITYTLDNGNSCTARFNSEDAFHWQAGPRAPM